MADKENVVAALSMATKTCAAAKLALSNHTGISEGRTGVSFNEDSSDARADSKEIPLQTLLTDYSSLLSLVYASTTKIALTLKPSDPTYSAALAPLRDVTSQVDALASCTCSIDADLHGKALVRELRWSTEAIVDAISSFFGCFLDQSAEKDSYLAKTGSVHEAVERARQTSKSNVEAVAKRWEADKEGLNDCVKEVAEMIEEESSDDIPSDGESGDSGFDGSLSDDDGWGELGASLLKEKHIKASQEDLARLNAAHLLLKFIHGLHKRVLSSFILKPVFRVPSNGVLDELSTNSSALLRATDELVPALYIPHDVRALSAELASLNGVLVTLRGHLTSLGLAALPGQKTAAVVQKEGHDDCEEVTQRLSSMALQNESVPQITPREGNNFNDKLMSESRWINTCFAQISKSFDAMKVM